jgi:L-alanine-DL-glutamate epimerase-like enolase superfamily enzyme
MTVTSVSTAVIEANFDWTLVRVDTDEGISGLGEAFFAPGLTAIIRDLGSIVVGRDPRALDAIVLELRAATSGAGSRSGIIHNAISGVDAALFDCVARKAGVPIVDLLGGRHRDLVKVYVDCHGGNALESLDSLLRHRLPSWQPGKRSAVSGKGYFWKEIGRPDPPSATAAAVKRCIAAGFTAIKLDADLENPHFAGGFGEPLSDRAIAYVRSHVVAAGKAGGDDLAIAVDCHWRFRPSDALRLARALEDLNLLWLEDPVPPDDPAQMADVASRTPIPICTGENLTTLSDFLPLLERRAVAILSPDVQKVGGLLEAKRIADYAAAKGIAIAPHNISSPIGTMIAAHYSAAVSNFIALEWHGMSVPFWNDIVRSPDGPIIRDGHIAVPRRPGSGVELNERAARKYARRGEPWFGN